MIFAQVSEIAKMAPSANDVAAWSASGTIQAIAILCILAGVAGIAFMARAFLASNKEVNENYEKSIEQQKQIHDQTREDYRDGLALMQKRFEVYDTRYAEAERRYEKRDERTIAAMEHIAKGITESSKRT